MSLGELSSRLQRAVHVARVEQQEQHTGLALPSCHRSQAARQGRRPISVHASAATIEYVDALYIRMLLACREGAVPRVERHLVWHCQLTANCYQAARQPVNVAVAVFIRHRDRVR